MSSNRASTYLNYLVFAISPILGFPLMVIEIYRKNKSSVVLISLLLALLSFYWVPPSYFDKAHYIVFYEEYKHLDFSSFLSTVLSKKADFIFYLILYLCASLNIKFYFCIGFITFITSYFIHDFFFKMSSIFTVDKSTFIWFFLGITISISFAYFFSGIRFYLAISIFLKSLFYLNTKQKKKFIFLFILSVMTHFGTIAFLPAILLHSVFNKKARIIKLLFILSFVMLFITRELLLSLLDFGFFGEIISHRINVYLDESDNVERQLADGSAYFTIKYYLAYCFHIIALLFSVLNIKRNDNYFLIVLVCLMTVNIFGSAPFLFLRLSLVANTTIFFVLLFLSDKNSISKFRRQTILLIVPVVAILFLLDVALFLPSFSKYSSFTDFISLFSVFFENIPDYPPPTNG